MLRRNLLLAAGCLLAAFAHSAQAEEAVNWAPNLQAAVNMASRQNQLVLIHFWAPNCPPCRALEQNVFTRPDVAQAIARDYVPVKVNAAMMPDTARKYGVDRWPMDVIVTPAGYALHSMVSPQDPREYMQSLYQVAAKRTPGRGLTSSEPAAPSVRNDAWGGQPQGPDQLAATNGYATGGQYQGNRFDQPQGGSPYQGDQGSWGQPQQQMVNNPSQQQPTDNRFAAPPQENRFSNYGGEQNRFGDDRMAQPQYSGGRFGGEQTAQYGQPYANPYGQEQAAQPRDDRFADPRGQAQYDPRQKEDPRWGEQASPRETWNPYIADSRGGQGMQNPNAGPQQPAPHQPPVAQPAPRADGAPPTGLEGFCPVTLVEQTRWTRGDKRFGIVHRGYVYLFASEAEKQKFWKDPDMYAPVLSGNDPVAFVETGKLIQGNRRHGVFFRNQIYLFTSEESLQRFWNSPERYAEVAMQAMRQGGDRR